ncbi:MAG: mucoidy inhibitor MuiA family protein [Planctomycetes bacterium]|nr:mucoidy inhibitor MuiA family protein [Planctomycetota bacterium]
MFQSRYFNCSTWRLELALGLCLLLPPMGAEETAAPEGTAIASRIGRVLVYSDQAMVTRRAEIAFQKETERLLLEGLPFGLADDSVRVRFEDGPNAPRLLNLEVILVHRSEFQKEEAKQASEELKKLNREAQALRDQLSGLDGQAAFLRSLRVGALPPGHQRERTDPVPLHVAAWGSTLETVSGSLRRIAAERLQLEDKMDELQSAITVARARAQRLLSYETKSSKTAALEVRGQPGGRAFVEVSYLIAGPQWFPRYDVRANLSAGTLELSMDALVRQETGEDWKDVSLEFSAAEPSRSADLPKLLAWHIGPSGGVEGRRELLALAGPWRGRGTTSQKLSFSKMSQGEFEANAPAQPQPSASKPAEQIDLEEKLQMAQQAPNSSGASENPSNNAIDSVQPQVQQAPMAGKAGKTRQKLESVQRLYQQQSESLGKGDYSKYLSDNRALVESYGKDAEVQKAFGDLLNKAKWNIERASRLMEAQKLATGVISPVQSSGGYDYKYRALRAESVASDGAFSRVTLTRESVPATFFYEIVPELAQRAYLQATLKNPFRSPLLAGPAGIFLGNDFVTQGEISTTSSGEELKAGLGVDEGIVVSRAEEVKRETTGLGGNRYTHHHAVTVKVRNDKNREIAVQVMERIPFSTSKDLAIKEELLDPAATKVEKGGLKRWDLRLQPGEEKTITVRYTVSHPSRTRLVPRENQSLK